MTKILLNVSDAQKTAWAAAAATEGVSLSEWVRRAGDERAGGGPGDTPHGSGVPLGGTQADRGAASPLGASAPARPFRGPDPKPPSRK